MNMEYRWNTDKGELKYLEKNLSLATSSTINCFWRRLVLNMGHCDEMLLTA